MLKDAIWCALPLLARRPAAFGNPGLQSPQICQVPSGNPPSGHLLGHIRNLASLHTLLLGTHCLPALSVGIPFLAKPLAASPLLGSPASLWPEPQSLRCNKTRRRENLGRLPEDTLYPGKTPRLPENSQDLTGTYPADTRKDPIRATTLLRT